MGGEHELRWHLPGRQPPGWGSLAVAWDKRVCSAVRLWRQPGTRPGLLSRPEAYVPSAFT